MTCDAHVRVVAHAAVLCSCARGRQTHLSMAKHARLGGRLDGRAVMQATAFSRSTFHILEICEEERDESVNALCNDTAGRDGTITEPCRRRWQRLRSAVASAACDALHK
jgi:hypothetical protein